MHVVSLRSLLPLGFVAALIALPLVGCTRVQALPASEAPVALPGPAVLQGGDLIEIKFPYAPELNDSQTIRADGMISLQLIGEVKAAGVAPGELSSVLEERYTAHLKRPEVTVVLRNELSRRVFVGGEVRLPSVVAMPATMSVLDALTLAGGLNLITAAPGHVIVMRTHEDGRRVGYRVDLRPAMRGEATRPFPLAPGDHVYVPRTAIANINQFMRQYVAGVIPQTGVVASQTNGSTVIGIDTSSYGGL